MSMSDLVGLLVLLVIFRLIRGVLGRVGRAVTSRDVSRSGTNGRRGIEENTASVPEPPLTDARRGAARTRSTIGQIGARPEIGEEKLRRDDSEAPDGEGQKPASGGMEGPDYGRRKGPLDELMRESPLVGGIVMREVLGPPRAKNPYRPLKR